MPLHPENTKTLVSRIPADHPDASVLRQAVTACLAAAERLEAKRAALERGGRLTPAGQRQELVEALKQQARDWRDGRVAITETRAKLETMRAGLKARPPTDPGDLVGELRRQELRSVIAEMPAGERAAFVLGSEDPQVAEAILGQPCFVSGLASDAYEKVQAAYVQRVNAGALQEIEALGAAVAAAETGALVARNELAQISGLEPREFSEIFEPIVHRQKAPWLVGSPGKEMVVIVGQDGASATYRAASDEERREGKFYKDLEEYKQAMAA
jgi:hypothetical protein